ncbi:hypothetical protein NBRC116493_07070 [Aurantivibrio infirmus]
MTVRKLPVFKLFIINDLKIQKKLVKKSIIGLIVETDHDQNNKKKYIGSPVTYRRIRDYFGDFSRLAKNQNIASNRKWLTRGR